MKYLTVYFIALLFGTFVLGCIVEDSPGNDCNPGDERCALDIVQICDNGSWLDSVDCAAQGMQCTELGGGAQCIDDDSDTGADTDTDTDSDTDSNYQLREDFESYKVGDWIIATEGSPWYSWSSPMQTMEDAQVVSTQAFSGSNSLHIEDYTEGEGVPANVVLLFGHDSGSHIIGFEIFVEEDAVGYYSFLQVFDGDEGSIWGFEVYFYPYGEGSLIVGEEEYPFGFDNNEWVFCKHTIDIDSDTATVRIGGVDVHTWPWSAAQGGSTPAKIESVNFRGMTESSLDAGYYVDDIGFTTPEDNEKALGSIRERDLNDV